MKNLLIIFCSLFFSLSYSQEKKLYSFFVELNHFSNAPKFTNVGGLLVYDGDNRDEKAFFSQYEILDFFQAFPDSRKERTLNMFTVFTYDRDLINDIRDKFPSKYLRVEDLSDIKVEFLDSYTDDYGITSPNPNYGVAASLKNLDYVHVPKAWDYTKGEDDVIIGISDSKIDTSDVDFKFKTTFQTPHADQTEPYDPDNDGTYHGTGVTAIAAAQGDNAHGTVGVCSDCLILATAAGYGSLGTYTNPQPNYNRLLQLALGGAKVINMSWINQSSLTGAPPITTYQWVIDELYEMNVVLVAGAGNADPWSINPTTGLLYYYPASYDHVISVSSVNHKNTWSQETETHPTWGEISLYVEDMIAPKVYTNVAPGPVAIKYTHTNNDKVDICAPGYQYFRYAVYLGEGVIVHNGGGTSASTPHVSGTVGLMLSLNDCLINDETEDILKLTAKNIEILQGNEYYVGRIGAGKLETGDAVEFVYEMMQLTGNALIDGHDFYRDNFNLSNINNKLTISNQKFRDNCTADFTAKNIIEVLPDSDFKPGSSGYVDLKIDENIDGTCVGAPRMNMNHSQEKEPQVVQANTALYPNPNNGAFDISMGKALSSDVMLEVYDIYGKLVFSNSYKGSTFTVSIPSLSDGMYIAKLTSGDYQETIKFIKK